MAESSTPQGSCEEEVLVLKKIRLLASTALVVGCLAAFAPAASAGEVCVSLYLQVNDQIVDQNHCVPTP